MHEIAVIILSYNTREITLDCLDKLKSSIDYLNKPVQTIVVENGNDGTGKYIKKSYKWVKLIEPSKNTGFAIGNNLGIKAADKNINYFLFLNSDALVQKDTLTQALDYMHKNSDCDVLGCQLKFISGKTQPSAGYLPCPNNIFFWMMGFDFLIKNPVHPKYVNFFQKDRQVEWVMGAFMFMKSEVIKKTHGFDENFFMYMEEVDWCKRIKDSGFKIWYTPKFGITHLDKASNKGNISPGIIKEATGLIYYAQKYFPDRLLQIKIAAKLGMGLRAFVFKISGNKERYNAHWQAYKQI